VTATANHRVAIWALTPGGARLAAAIAAALPGSTLLLSQRVAGETPAATPFTRLADAVDRWFATFSGHVFVMATGIVVRSIAGHLEHKTRDPAVVVCDEAGRFAISLLSGHVGGANRLARQVAAITGGQPVITTASDVNGVAAIDVIAVDHALAIENPAAIKTVNMALVTGNPIRVHDPYDRVVPHLPQDQVRPCGPGDFDADGAGVFVDHIHLDLPPHVLVLRPRSLVAGVGCNRGTDATEIRGLLERTFAENRLTLSSLRAIATVDLKADEPGLLTLAENLAIPLRTFTRDRLGQADPVPTPSTIVEKHIGVPSVCEAAALLATHRGRLIVPKQKTRNVTVAVAADGCISSALAPAAPTT
jgi:cobalt-precorrin 5A hydrolase